MRSSLKNNNVAIAGRRRTAARIAASAARAGEVVVPRREVDTFAPDARARAILAGRDIAETDLADSGGAYDLEQVQVVLNRISRQAVFQRVKQGKLLAVPGPGNRRLYPVVQFNRDGTVVEGLHRVHEALPTDNPWTMLNFLVNPDDRLQGRRPIDVLREGDVAAVVSAAEQLAEPGA